MVDRRDISSWLEGPPSRGDGHWPGQRLGRPRNGAGSIARPGRRLGALAIDWALCSLISAAFFGYDGTATLGIFALEQMLLVGSLGYSVGHRVFGMQVQRLEGTPAGLVLVSCAATSSGVHSAGSVAGCWVLPVRRSAPVRHHLLCLRRFGCCPKGFYVPAPARLAPP